jgi:hypothetical protein
LAIAIPSGNGNREDAGTAWFALARRPFLKTPAGSESRCTMGFAHELSACLRDFAVLREFDISASLRV